jgi:micrococcal nuclease
MMLAASCATGQGGSAPPDMPRAFGEVTRVPDGDTIDVATSEGTVTVRLAAINAPDRGECQAEEARAHLRDAFPDGSARLEILGTDQFDRTVGHVFDGDRHINLEMVAMGLALASTPDDADPYGATILEAEEGAYREGAGLWGPAACGASADLPALGIDGAASEPDPAGPDDEHLRAEYIVISNSRDSPVDLDGWTIRDESSLHRFHFPSGTSIAANDSVIVTSDSTGWDPGGGPVWNNDGDMALLLAPDGVVVARWRY